MTTLVVGLGNPWRGDDGVGPAVARELRRLRLTDVDVACADDDLLTLLDAWPGYSQVVIVDAVKNDSAPGTVHRFDVTEAPLPATLSAPISTHAVPLGTAIELARRLGRMPRRLVVIGIEADGVEAGRDLSPAVRRSLAAALDEIRALCSRHEAGG